MHSFVEMTQYLLAKHSEDNLFLLSERFSQDPLENYFGKQRARGGRSDNPTIQRSLQNAGALRIQKSLALDPVRGNSRKKRRLFDGKDELTVDDIDNTPLPKRKRQGQNRIKNNVKFINYFVFCKSSLCSTSSS